MSNRLIELIPEFVEELEKQLIDDEKRWGETWRNRDLLNQNERIFAHLNDYYDQYRFGGKPIQWLKVAGLALIAWVRENHPEELVNE